MADRTETKLLRENNFKIVGKLVQADVREGTNDKGDFINVNVVIESILKGEKNEFHVSYYTKKMTSAGKVSKLYETYSRLPELVNHKVETTGELRENRYWNSNAGQLVSIQTFSGRFINGVVESATDVGTYNIGGVIVRTLAEKKNKKDEVYRYDLSVMQANYYGDSAQLFTLHIDPNDREIVSGVENYELGATVRFTGDLDFRVKEETVEDDNVAFGAPTTRVFVNKYHNFFIKGGSNPYEDERAYAKSDIETFSKARTAHDIELQNASKEDNMAFGQPASTKPSFKQTSLI